MASFVAAGITDYVEDGHATGNLGASFFSHNASRGLLDGLLVPSGQQASGQRGRSPVRLAGASDERNADSLGILGQGHHIDRKPGSMDRVIAVLVDDVGFP